MAIIKLKILNQTGQTLATSPAGENTSLVYTGHYQLGGVPSGENGRAPGFLHHTTKNRVVDPERVEKGT